MRSVFGLFFLVLIVHATPARARGAAVSDSLYNAHHPRLLFTPAELPALRAKVQDSGYAADAYGIIRERVETFYPLESERTLLETEGVGIGDMPCLVLFAHMEQPMNALALDKGRRVTEWLVDSTVVDEDTFNGPLRLRALAMGYDAFYADATPEMRGRVVGRMEAFVDTMLTGFWFGVRRERPFLTNQTTMIASALGIGAIALDGETDPARVSAALARADDYIETWLTYQMDPDGSYKEGAMYGGWSMRNLVYYFWARKRYDGKDWSADPRVRNMEKWVAYALLPVGAGEVNNINDTSSRNYPYARHHAYFDFAQAAWNSRLSLWLWERLAGPYGHDAGRLRDPAATVLWNRDLAPVNPESALPHHFLWRGRGQYYFRTGWPQQSLSDDVVFSFHSGVFQGGHAHEDQNSFTLYGYGERFAMDSGFLSQNWETEAHNLTLIDGRGEHNAGGTIGTDGNMTDHLLGGFADYLFGDATRAYTIHSDFNLPDVPFVGMDWSYGYDGGNPVEYAHRRFIVVHGDVTPPYIVLVEDIRKDDAVHTYEWRMHTDEAHTVDVSSNPIRITGATGHMDLHVVAPAFGDITRSLGAYDNGNDDPNSTVIRLEHDAVAESFVLFFMPEATGTNGPAMTTDTFAWGSASRVAWQSGEVQWVAVNHGGGVAAFFDGVDSVATDARIAVLRAGGGNVDRHLLTDVTTLSVDGVALVTVDDGPADVALSGSSVEVSRADALYRVYAPGATAVTHHGDALRFVRDGDYVVADTSSGPSRPPAATRVFVEAYPSPFRGSTTIEVHSPSGGRASIDIYDALGRRVAHAVRTSTDGVARFEWAGEDDGGTRVSSGVYFVRAHTAAGSATHKIVVVR